MYRSASYYIGKIIAEAPIKSTPTILYCATIYFLARMNVHPERFFRFLALVLLIGKEKKKKIYCE